MLFTETGTNFLGFTKKFKCSNCHNETEHVLRQAYIKQSLFIIPIASKNSTVYINCPVCETKENILTSKFWSSAEKLSNVVSLLEGGKETTKIVFKKMDFKEQEALLKRLNKLEAYAVVRYLGS